MTLDYGSFGPSMISHEASNKWNYHARDLASFAALGHALRYPMSTPNSRVLDADFQTRWRALIFRRVHLFREIRVHRDSACHSREAPNDTECHALCRAHPPGSTR